MSDERKENKCLTCGRIFHLKISLQVHQLQHKKIVKQTNNKVKDAPAVKDELNRGKVTVECVKKDDSFKCDICGKVFLQEKNLRSHLSVHSYQQNACCTLCNKNFSKVANLRSHLKKHELREKYRCSICDKGFLSQNSLDKHVSIKHGTNKKQSKESCCYICSETFLNRTDLIDHMVVHKKDLTCVVCKKKFDNFKRLKSHMRHRKTVQCDQSKETCCYICSETFLNRTDLNDHMVVHKKDLTCVVCKKRFDNFKRLKRHMRLHKTVLCDQCGKFIGQKSFPLHVLVHTRAKPYKCAECGACFRQQGHCIRHMRSHEYNRTYARDFHCDLCGNVLATRAYLIRHHKLHFVNSSFNCELCSYTCSNYLNISQHYEDNHPQNLISCEICSKKFYSQSVLYTHYLMHPEEELRLLDKNLQSSISENRTFVKRTRMRKSKINKEYKFDSNGHYKCSYCIKTSIRRIDIDAHERIHTGERPFTCTICNKSFIQRAHLTTHVALHSGDKPFKCNICGKSFSIQNYLYNHKKIHSKDASTSTRSKKALEYGHYGKKHLSKKSPIVYQISYMSPVEEESHCERNVSENANPEESYCEVNVYENKDLDSRETTVGYNSKEVVCYDKEVPRDKCKEIGNFKIEDVDDHNSEKSIKIIEVDRVLFEKWGM